jgi:hypothetical protein
MNGDPGLLPAGSNKEAPLPTTAGEQGKIQPLTVKYPGFNPRSFFLIFQEPGKSQLEEKVIYSSNK